MTAQRETETERFLRNERPSRNVVSVTMVATNVNNTLRHPKWTEIEAALRNFDRHLALLCMQ
jgi:hypothetical protein